MLAFISLLVGHLLLREYMPNPAVGLVGFLLIIAIQGYVLLARNDVFSFVMIVYICSHFSYADNQGGLWALIAGILILIRIAFRYRNEKLQKSDTLIYTLIVIFVAWNVMGWVLRSPVSLVERTQAIIAFVGFLGTFLLVSNLAITPERFRTFLVLVVSLLVYQVAVAVNNRYAVINWNTPLIGAYSDGGGAITYGSTNAWGTFRHAELFGEYGALFWTFLIPILCCSRIQTEVRFRVQWILLSMLLALVIIAITSTRSAALLAGAAVFVYLFVFPAFSFKAIDRFGRQVQLGIVIALIVPMLGAFVGLDSLKANFAELGGTEFSSDSVLSGQAINRAPLFDYAVKRLGEESLVVGYGFGTLRSNLWAWTGVDPSRVETIADFHNLYLSLPFLYGWPGAIAFLGIIVVTAWRCWSAALRFQRQGSFLVAVAVGFSIFWGVLMVDQMKISILRISTYHMLFWVWLGLTTAVTRTLIAKGRTRTAASGQGPAGQAPGPERQ